MLLNVLKHIFDFEIRIKLLLLLLNKKGEWKNEKHGDFPKHFG